MAIVWVSLNILCVLVFILGIVSGFEYFDSRKGQAVLLILVLLSFVGMGILHYWFLLSPSLQHSIINTFGKTFFDYLKWRMILK
ncbi:hypothetical protein M3M39_04985 [Fructilactobacillus hinvesii]|uniref:Uncharacterized protein n=1 Tax=Fructilactobacillus hinvesii TaxID=2940300 RepID=A0ABY5BRI3_9LACO|nr:hypothetical protein [Fructilactobacillus hinvesii]USS87479.1 hypothetical protein M3M39_04985 [Fructilactobacillus hinvesii]